MKLKFLRQLSVHSAVLSKLNWYFTVADISKTWILEHLLVNSYIQKWLDISISGTLSNVFLECNKFGLNIKCSLSVKFTQCQTVLKK